MKIKLPLVSLCLLLASNVRAQTPDYPVYRHSVGVGFERIGLDAPDALSNRYLVGYARHLHNDRFVVAGNMGYVNALNREDLGVNNQYIDGKRRKRVTADLTASFDFIRHPRHAFRIGAGPSLWYRDDEVLRSLRYNLNLTTGEVTNVRTTWEQIKEVNFGYNVLVEYEYALTQQVLVSGKMKFFSSREAGQSTIYGFGLGYRFGQ